MLDKRFRLNLDGRPNPKCVVQGDKYRFTVLTSQMRPVGVSWSGLVISQFMP